MAEPIYVSQEELEEEKTRVETLKQEIPERRKAIENLEPRIDALLEKIPERREEIERLRRSIRTHSGWVTRRREALSEYMGIISALGRRPDFLTRMALWARKELVARHLKERSPAKTRADIDAREKEITRLWGRIGGLTSSLHAQESELRTLRSRRAALIRWIREREAELAYEQERLTRKIVKPPVKLHRIKIRLYNQERRPTPEGTFQGFFSIDAVIDPETGEPDWTWWLTAEETDLCRYHLIGYLKGASKWLSPSQVSLTRFSDEGIPDKDSPTQYKYKETGEPYTKHIPDNYIKRAERLTIGELVVGESSEEPEPVDKPKGVYFDQVMIIKDGLIVWQERRDRWCWKPPDRYIERVKEELGI